jgi:hypothetical protein
MDSLDPHIPVRYLKTLGDFLTTARWAQLQAPHIRLYHHLDRPLYLLNRLCRPHNLYAPIYYHHPRH